MDRQAHTMKTAIQSGLILLMATSLTLLSQDAERGRKIYAENAASVLVLYAQSPDGEFVAQGSGFCIASQKIITNAHVANAGKIFVQLGPARVAAHLEKIDNRNDLAVLTVPAEITVKPLKMASKLPSPGDSIFAITNPEGLEKTISQGVVSSVREMKDRTLLQITAPISPGSSGGPIFDANGEVVGVAVGGLSIGQNLNFAVPISFAKKLLQSGDSLHGTDISVTFQELASVRAERDSEKYSADPDSTYQIKQGQVETLLRKALDQAGANPTLLLRVSEEATPDDPELAILAARRAVEVKPSPENQLALAKALSAQAIFMQGNDQQKLLHDAEKAARASLSSARTPPADTLYTLADILQNEQLCAEAEKYFRLALSSAQESSDSDLQAEAIRGLANCTYDLNKPNEGQRWFNMLASSGKANYFDWWLQGQRLGSLNQYREAGDAYTTAAQLITSYKPWCLAGQNYYFASELDLSLSANRKCIERGTGRKGSESDLAEAHSEIAGILNQRGVYTEALNHAKEATALDPNNAFHFHALAEALVGLHRYYEAVNAAQQAIRLSDGKYGSMHFRLGSAYFELQNWEFARESFERAAELQPTDPASAYNVALSYQRLRYFIDAAKWYEEYLRRKPNANDRSEIIELIRTLRGH